MNLILLGPPGAGKGTQAKFIAKKFNLYQLSTGDLLREEIKNKTEIGKKIKHVIAHGDFVVDEIVNQLLKTVIKNSSNRDNIIFDGYPRNLQQAKELDLLIKEKKQKISCVINLDVDKESLVKRILGRQTCSNCGLIFNKFFNTVNKNNHKCEDKYIIKRSDDNEKTIRDRFETYINKTLPILRYYKEQNLLHQINGVGKIDDISNEISSIIASIVT